MSSLFTIRSATIDDAPIMARHRARMFAAMGTLPPALFDGAVEATIRYLGESMPAGIYHAWLAAPTLNPGTIVGGAGVLLRRVPPHPRDGLAGTTLAEGRQGLVLNVFTEPAWRRKGIAKLLMETILNWAAATRLDSLVLHASSEGRQLYEQLGFATTNEMRFPARLLDARTG